jgi:hypothetical protein
MSITVGGWEVVLEPNGSMSGNRRLNRYIKHYSGHIGTWEVGFNGFRTTGNTYAAYPAGEHGFMDLDNARSLHITANLFTFSTRFTRNNVVGMTMGVGVSFNDYAFDTKSAYVKVDGMLHPVAVDHQLKKAKLNTLSIHIPLALEVSPSRNFFFSVGGYADLLIGSHMKWKFPKEKLLGPSTNFLQAGVTARLGFRKVYVFGNYNCVEMFRSGRGPAVNAYSFGLGLGF